MFSCPKCPDHKTGYGYSAALCPKHTPDPVAPRTITPPEKRIREKLLGKGGRKT